MTIKELTHELNKKIRAKMRRFNDIASRVHEMNESHYPQEDIDKQYIKMAEIFQELRPVEWVIRHQNPSHNQLFDDLNNLWHTNKKPRKFKPVMDTSDNITLRSQHD